MVFKCMNTLSCASVPHPDCFVTRTMIQVMSPLQGVTDTTHLVTNRWLSEKNLTLNTHELCPASEPARLACWLYGSSMAKTVSLCGVGGKTYTSYIFKCLSSEAVTSNIESGENVNERIGMAWPEWDHVIIYHMIYTHTHLLECAITCQSPDQTN